MRAFTLIETLITIAVFVVLMGIAASFFFRFGTLSTYQYAVQNVSGSGSAALEELRRAVAGATRVVPSHSFSDAIRTSTTTSLVLELPALDRSGAPVIGAYDYEAFFASSSSLYREIEADAASSRASSTKRLSDALTALSFAYSDANLANATTVSMTLSTGTTTRAGAVAGGGSLIARLRNL